MKQIQLQHIIPLTIQDRIDPKSQIWNCNIVFKKGVFYTIKAISGSGKSTFINSLYGIRKDFEGDLLFDNQSVKSHNDDAFSSIRNKELSIVFQDLRLFEQLTAQENILIKSESKELSPLQKQWTKTLKIDNLLQQSCNKLSYGERQRVAIVRALSQEFDFLLLDEPFSHLDIENGKAAYRLILEQAKAKKAGIILTSLGNESYLESDLELSL